MISALDPDRRPEPNRNFTGVIFRVTFLTVVHTLWVWQDEFDDVGEPVVAADGRAWSVERSSVFAQRKRQSESKGLFNTREVRD